MRRFLLAAALAAIAATACDEASAPEGREGSLTVQAYIDSDASGTRTDADQPVSGIGITISRDGADVATQQTAADGSVTFDGLAPGSYRVRASGTLPAGVMLISNPEPSAVINVRGDPVSIGFQYTILPSRISGRVVRVADDAGAENVRVVLTRAGTTDTVATTTTDATGAYEFERLPAGSYHLEFEQAGAIDYGTEGNTRDVTLVAGQETTIDVNYTGSIFITVAEARAATVGTRVAVIADVTVPAGRFTSSSDTRSEIWVQDATGGISVFSVATADAALYPVGQRVEVVGLRGAFSGQEQIQGNTESPLVVRQRTGGVVRAAKTITAAAAKSLADEGQLVRVTGLTVVTIGTANTSGAFNVTVSSATNDTLVIRIHGDDTGITPASFTVGSSYDVTGVLTQNNATVQIKPRFASDVVVTPVPGTGPKIVINEFMANPNAVADNQGEWIELYNAGTTSVDIQNWTIRDATGNSDVIDVPLVVAPGAYVVLGVNSDIATNGGVVVDFVYPSVVSLNQTGDQIILRDALGVTVDSILYPSTGATAGISRGVLDPTADNADAGGPNWSSQTSVYGAGDRGTPRAQNDGYIAPVPQAPVPEPTSLPGSRPMLPSRRFTEEDLEQ